MPLLMAACSERSSGEFLAHSSSRAARALLVAIVGAVVAEDGSVVIAALMVMVMVHWVCACLCDGGGTNCVDAAGGEVATRTFDELLTTAMHI